VFSVLTDNGRMLKGKQMKFLLVDLYTGNSEIVSGQYVADLTEGLEAVEGDRLVWRSEEYIVIRL